MAKENRAAAGSKSDEPGLFRKFENWSQKNNRKIFVTLLLGSLVLALLSFNARISEAHDDALYLEAGWRFVNEFPEYFYTQNAPLYPLFLAAALKVMGFRLIIFKLFSVLFHLLGFTLFYKALRNRVPAVVFLPVVLFHAVNHLILYFASMTFTEAFYFFLQGLLFYSAAKIIDLQKDSWRDIRANSGAWLLFGLSMFLISTGKSAAIVVIPAVILFFIIEKKYIALFSSLLVYLLFKVPYEIVIKLVWKAQNQFKNQGAILLQKDPYDASLGNEDLWGFVNRFFENLNLSLSKRFYQLLGFREDTSTDTYIWLALGTLALALFGFWKLLRHNNKLMVLLALFTGAQLVLSYSILQTRWDQPRITLVCMPIMLMLIFYGIYVFSIKKEWPVIYLGTMLLVSASVCLSSFKRASDNVPVIKRNLKGDKYFGYTPDWQNFLKCSEWCAENLPDSALVASRKAPMSFVYGNGKKFFPIYSVIHRDSVTKQSNPDSALVYLKKNGVSHVMLASLRVNPNYPQAGIINTVHYIIIPVAQKYPDKLKLIHTEGLIEETYLYEIVY